MPQSLSATRHPTGLAIQPGMSWTVDRCGWVYAWAVVREPEADARRRSLGEERDDS